jgi:hypothetical protein
MIRVRAEVKQASMTTKSSVTRSARCRDEPLALLQGKALAIGHQVGLKRLGPHTSKPTRSPMFTILVYRNLCFCRAFAEGILRLTGNSGAGNSEGRGEIGGSYWRAIRADSGQGVATVFSASLASGCERILERAARILRQLEKSA